MAVPRNRGLVRALTLARRVEGLRRLPSINELAHAFNVHRRTICRDLAALEEAGWLVPERYTDEHEEVA